MTERPERTAMRGGIVVLDDQIVLAMKLGEDLEAIGCSDVHVFSTAEDVAAHLARAPIAFALLDYRLGGCETSEDLALRLHANGVPFAFVTGMAELPGIDARLAVAPRFDKPASPRLIARHLAGLGLL